MKGKGIINKRNIKRNVKSGIEKQDGNDREVKGREEELIICTYNENRIRLTLLHNRQTYIYEYLYLPQKY